MSREKAFNALIAVGVLIGVSCSLVSSIQQNPLQKVSPESTQTIKASTGGEITLPDQTILKIPANSLSNDTQVSIRKISPNEFPVIQEEFSSVGGAYEINLGSASLVKPASLEIPFDPASLPNGATADKVFLSYFDEAAGQWVFAGGKVDLVRNVVVLEITHASWWMPTTWNWGAWIAVLNKSLKISIVDWIDAIKLLTDDCPQKGNYVQVDSSQALNVLQGCVETDDSARPELRVVNPKSFYFEIKPVSRGNGYPALTMLAPGDEVRFEASTSDPSPLVVQAEITQRSGYYLVLHMILTMLPGANQFGLQPTTVACITERMTDVSNIASAVGSLLEHNGSAAAESISKFLLDKDAVRRFLTAADDCHFGPAATWSLEGIEQIGAAVSTIMSATDYTANYLAGNSLAQVSFIWKTPETSAGEIAFVNNKNIWVMDPGNGQSRQITQLDQNNQNLAFHGLAWSPNGDWLAFSNSLNGNFDIFMIKADGSASKQVTTDSSDDEFPTFSTNDALFFIHTDFLASQSPEILLIKLDPGSETQEMVSRWDAPCWPRSISVLNNTEIAVTGWCGTGAGNSYWTQLINSPFPDFDAFYPSTFAAGPCQGQHHPVYGGVWAHGAPYLAFIDRQDCFDPMTGLIDGPDSIYILNLNTDAPTSMAIYTGTSADELTSLDWSPDNRYIVFDKKDNGLWIINIQTGELRQITTSGSDPVWRP